MNHRVWMFWFLCAPFAAGCFQEIDTGADKRSVVVDPAAPGETADPGDGKIPTLTTTPTIDIVADPNTAYTDTTNNGVVGTTSSACEANNMQVMSMFTRYCGGCHNGQNQGTPPFNFILDPKQLTTVILGTSFPKPLVIPGDPDQSEVYIRIATGRMPVDTSGLNIGQLRPPAQSDGVTRPTLSDLSVIREWINSCLGATAASP
jgi:hypothetical protein